ncbi:hypothetical protein JCGZ_05931 [Jatropha curcas]|uniref:Uncharacterized protein n=1 Tax=Jatropha curcas TaxID=180498 RepID=A0A067KMY1_JATCU|nr:hypothetical protein JCGZ_05931 [Jatropha curcas]
MLESYKTWKHINISCRFENDDIFHSKLYDVPSIPNDHGLEDKLQNAPGQTVRSKLYCPLKVKQWKDISIDKIDFMRSTIQPIESY